jgi:hypothetical protein
MNDTYASISVFSKCPGTLNGTADNDLNSGHIRRVESVDCIFQDMAGRCYNAVVDQSARAEASEASWAANFYLNRAWEGGES